MKTKGKLIYKIISTITLLVPLPIYLILSATLFNIVPDYTIDNVTIEEVNVIEYEDYNFLYVENAEAIYSGVVVQDNGLYGFYMDEDDILQIESDYYNNDLTDIKKLEIKKETSYKLPLAFFISLMGVGIVALIISGKMQLYKKYPRISTLIGLLTGTIILYVMNIIVSNIFSVFLIATVSWAVYCIEYMIKEGIINKDQAEKQENDLIETLKKALN